MTRPSIIYFFPCRSPMLGERNVVHVVFIYRIRILSIFRKLRILKMLNFLTYILIAFNTTTIRITDSFSTDYTDLPNSPITSSSHFHGLLPTYLQPSSSASVEIISMHFSCPEGIPNPCRRSQFYGIVSCFYEFRSNGIIPVFTFPFPVCTL